LPSFLRREVVLYGAWRWLAIIDPKGEYHALGDDLGMTILKLHPGGTTRLNPMDARPGGTT